MNGLDPLKDRSSGGSRAFLAVMVLLLAAGRSAAQQLEPRAYAPNPSGANFALVNYGYQSGDVVFDTSLPITNVTANINSTAAAYVRTFGLFGRSASAGIVLPYVWGHLQGDVGEQAREIHRSGLADTWLRLATNLLGGPAMTPAEFMTHKPSTTLGMSLFVVAPTGQYDPSRLINIGSNRWSFKPELGVSHPMGKWVFEVYAGVWLFTNNNDFFGGHVREQAPLGSTQAHVSYTFRPRLWVAADYTYYWGGRTTVDGVLNADFQHNSRFGLTLAVPVAKNQSIKVSWSKGAATRLGANFTTYTIAYQVLWFDKK